MVVLASQNFEDIRPLLTEYKQVSERRKVTIPEEFARREAMARAVTLPPTSAKLTPPGPSKDSQTCPDDRLWFLLCIPSFWTPNPPPCTDTNHRAWRGCFPV